MEDYRLGVVETMFADIIWQNEPLSSGELVKICEKQLSWKKSTTYTVLKKLCQRGIFQNEKGVVTSKISKSDFVSIQSSKFVEETFGGSLPAFFAAFTKKKDISKEELEQIRKMIDGFEEV